MSKKKKKSCLVKQKKKKHYHPHAQGNQKIKKNKIK